MVDVFLIDNVAVNVCFGGIGKKNLSISEITEKEVNSVYRT